MKTAAIVALGFVALLTARHTVPTNRVTVVNESGMRAEAVRIEVNGELTDLGDLQPGESASVQFCTPQQEDVIQLRCRLVNGTTIGDTESGEPCQYVTYADCFRQLVIIVRADGSLDRREN